MGDADRVIRKLEGWMEAARERWMDCGRKTPAHVRLKYYIQYQEREKCLEVARDALGSAGCKGENAVDIPEDGKCEDFGEGDCIGYAETEVEGC